jgi:hypothetical protein
MIHRSPWKYNGKETCAPHSLAFPRIKPIVVPNKTDGYYIPTTNKEIFFVQNACHAPRPESLDPLFPRVSWDMLQLMQKRNREDAASLQMQNASQTVVANSDIKITGVFEFTKNSISLERFDPKSENIRKKSCCYRLVSPDRLQSAGDRVGPACFRRRWVGGQYARKSVTSLKTVTLHNCH